MIVYKAVKGNEMFYLNPNKFKEVSAQGYDIYSSEDLESDKNDILIIASGTTSADIDKLIEEM